MEWGLGNITIIVFYIKIFEGPIANPPGGGGGFCEGSAQDTIYNWLNKGWYMVLTVKLCLARQQGPIYDSLCSGAGHIWHYNLVI